MTANLKLLEERFLGITCNLWYYESYRIQHVWLFQIREYLNYNDADEDKIWMYAIT